MAEAGGHLVPSPQVKWLFSTVLQLKQAPYILAAGKLGVSRFSIVRRHMLPHLLPQFLTGLILLFPHAILHEASVTFLGFGLSAEQPAIASRSAAQSSAAARMGILRLCIIV